MQPILFVNGSPHKDGNTARLAATLLKGRAYDTLDLVNYRIYEYGQSFDDDQFDEVMERVRRADTLVMGSPCYWHNLSGLLRCFLDRHYGSVERDEMHTARLAFVFQGEAPERWMFEAAEYTIRRYASLYGMEYLGMATKAEEAYRLATKL